MSRKENMARENKEIMKKEILVYQDRIDRIDRWKPIIDPTIMNCLPSIPLNYKLSQKGLYAVKISLYILNSVPIVLELARAFVLLWHKHLFNSLSLPARQIFEMWGALHYSYQLLIEIDDPNKINIMSIKIDRLMLGARSEVELPWGGLTKEKSINVMDFIRSLKDAYPNPEETYDFLCESCHPSFIRQKNWSMAGSRFSNWNNKNFNRTGRDLIDRTILAVETALEGYALDVKRSLELAMPYIQAEAPNTPNSANITNSMHQIPRR